MSCAVLFQHKAPCPMAGGEYRLPVLLEHLVMRLHCLSVLEQLRFALLDRAFVRGPVAQDRASNQ